MFPEFGEQHVSNLVQHFKPVLTRAGVAMDRIPEEWVELKVHIYVEYEYSKVNSF